MAKPLSFTTRLMMNRAIRLLPLIVMLMLIANSGDSVMAANKTTENTTVQLPEPNRKGEHSLEAVLDQRRSIRDLSAAELSLKQISQLLWAAQGITHARGLRTAPSAGALYPLELYLLVANVEGLGAGIYHYQPSSHTLTLIAKGDKRTRLAAAAYGQMWIKDSAAVLVIAAEYERTKVKYGKRGIRYVHIEVGHAAQNIYLQATALGLGTTVVGAFLDSGVAAVMDLDQEHEPLAILPLGKPR